MCKDKCDKCLAEQEERLELEKKVKELIVMLNQDLAPQEFFHLKNEIYYLIDRLK